MALSVEINTGTNHNAATLIWHAAKSVNKAAGKVDKVIYGDQPVPTNHISHHPPVVQTPEQATDISTIFAGIAGLIIIGIFIYIWAERYYKIKERWFGWR